MGDIGRDVEVEPFTQASVLSPQYKQLHTSFWLPDCTNRHIADNSFVFDAYGLHHTPNTKPNLIAGQEPTIRLGPGDTPRMAVR